MKSFKDILGNLWGACLAYVLPGLALLYALGRWNIYVEDFFLQFFTEPNFFIFLFFLGAVTILGLQISALSWVFFEIILFRVLLMKRVDMVELEFSEKYNDNRALLKEPFRYYQFLAAMTFVIPIFFSSIFNGDFLLGLPSYTMKIGVIFFVGVLELATIMGAVSSYKDFVSRASYLLWKEKSFLSSVESNHEKYSSAS